MDDEVWNHIESLANILYLLDLERDDRDRARTYCRMANEKLAHVKDAVTRFDSEFIA
jgi:hypothetical protein